MLRSLTLRTELLTLSGLSQLSDAGDYIVQSTPAEPDYWMGNQIIFKTTDVGRAQAEALFERHFPDARHRAFVWDAPDLQSEAISDDFAEAGYEAEHVDALVLAGPLRDAPLPSGITIRPFEDEADWIAALDLQEEVGIEQGYDQRGHRAYLAGRNKGRRSQIAKGLGQWFGAFDGDLLVAQMGIFHDDTVARYQAVETRTSHRRRGVCSALLRHAALWALDRAPQASVVIVAEANGPAGRLYRSMGFAHRETIRGVLRPGY